MKKSTLDQAVWTLIYGGMILAMVGLWSRDATAVIGSALAVAGGVAVVAGAVLVWVRSRRTDDAPVAKGGRKGGR